MTLAAKLYDDRKCELGEGPLWHPARQQLFWFDILGHRLLSRVAEAALEGGVALGAAPAQAYQYCI